MSRIDYKSGRFSADWETNKLFEAMQGWQTSYGDTIRYYHYNADASQMDPVYDEAVGVGRVYYPFIVVPCQHVIHIPGQNELGEYGMYYNDTLTATISYQAFTGAGMKRADIENGNYLDDRVLYDRKIFKVIQLLVRGQIRERDTIVAMQATQVKPDELVDDPEFADWASGGPNDLTGEE